MLFSRRRWCDIIFPFCMIIHFRSRSGLFVNNSRPDRVYAMDAREPNRLRTKHQALKLAAM